MNTQPLSSIRPGGRCVVDQLKQELSVRRRLMDMGLLPGAVIQCAFLAPAGSQIAFWIKGSIVALRRDDCEKILVKACE